ncbi:MAG: helix-turn-helix domain-containing protein [Candidatus Rokubacteria bacterium]|nr:helix-turn-helix domain-containing protein [Candidatus Rokubacteria bacterium]
MAQEETFGEFLRAQRLKAGFGLRAFAEAAGMQPSNLSNLEHGRLAPPQEKSTLDALAELLGLAPGSEERARLFDLAVASRERLPADVASFAARTPGIPVLLRTIENKGLGKKDLERLTEYVTKRLGRG